MTQIPIKFPISFQYVLLEKARHTNFEWGYDGLFHRVPKKNPDGERVGEEIIISMVNEVQGNETGIPPGGARHIIEIHTHPKIYGDIPYHPPSSLDYVSCISAYINNLNPFAIVAESHNFWVYTPTKEFVAKYGKVLERYYRQGGIASKQNRLANMFVAAKTKNLRHVKIVLVLDSASRGKIQ